MAADIESLTLKRVAYRFIPFLMLCYFVNYLDRVNVGFAKLTMDADLGLSDTAFGFGAGIFFLAYFLFEVPSNVIMDRVGARIWIARIMISWGIISGAMAFIPQISAWTGFSPEHTFYGLRFLLGLAEAGFFPGIIFFLTLWFPAAYRARIVSCFMAAIPLSSAIGSPVSAALLGLHGTRGLAGWQWLFIIEALPSILLAFVAFFYLTDRPRDATWLSAGERDWLQGRLDAEDARRAHVSPHNILASLYDYRVLALALVYFGNVACLYGVTFWLPSIVKGFGVSIAATGWISSIPYIVGFLGMVWWGLRSDRHGERTYHFGRRAAPRSRRYRRVGVSRRSCRKDDCADDRRAWSLFGAAAPMDPADGVSRRRGRCARHRRHQCDRQSLRLFWPFYHGLGQGSDWRFPLGTRYDCCMRCCRARHHPDARP